MRTHFGKTNLKYFGGKVILLNAPAELRWFPLSRMGGGP